MADSSFYTLQPGRTIEDIKKDVNSRWVRYWAEQYAKERGYNAPNPAMAALAYKARQLDRAYPWPYAAAVVAPPIVQPPPVAVKPIVVKSVAAKPVGAKKKPASYQDKLLKMMKKR